MIEGTGPRDATVEVARGASPGDPSNRSADEPFSITSVSADTRSVRSRLRDPLMTMLLTLGLIGGGGAALGAVGAATTVAPEAVCPPVATDAPSPSDAPPVGGSDPDTTDVATTDQGQPAGDPSDDPSDAQGPDEQADEQADEQGEDDQGEDQTCDEATDADPVPDPDEESEHQDDETTSDGAGDEGAEPSDIDPVERAAACNAAAGIDEGGSGGDAEVANATTGLEHAIERVLANCLKNSGAPGLPNALEHLVANAERKAAREAAKAAGEHGDPDEHRNSSEHGKSGEPHGKSGEPHGKSGEPHGHSGEHGNPHD